MLAVDLGWVQVYLIKKGMEQEEGGGLAYLPRWFLMLFRPATRSAITL